MDNASPLHPFETFKSLKHASHLLTVLAGNLRKNGRCILFYWWKGSYEYHLGRKLL